MDPLLALGLFVGIPVGLALVISVLIYVPQRRRADDSGVEVPEGLIASSAAVPNPAALPEIGGARVAATGGAHGNW